MNVPARRVQARCNGDEPPGRANGKDNSMGAQPSHRSTESHICALLSQDED